MSEDRSWTPSSNGWLESWLRHIDATLRALGQDVAVMSHRLAHLEQRHHPEATSSTSSSPSLPTLSLQSLTAPLVRAFEKALVLLPPLWQGLLWLLPRAIIGWGMLEGWWAAGWHWLRAFL